MPSSSTIFKRNFLSILLSGFFVGILLSAYKTDEDPWKSDQLMPPAVLAAVISSGNNVPVILNVGPADAIQGAIVIGPGSHEENKATLLKELKATPKNKEIVIYCGCCPMFKCPNIRPAYNFLTVQGFTNIRILNLENNLKINWVEKDYPMENGK